LHAKADYSLLGTHHSYNRRVYTCTRTTGACTHALIHKLGSVTTLRQLRTWQLQDQLPNSTHHRCILHSACMFVYSIIFAVLLLSAPFSFCPSLSAPPLLSLFPPLSPRTWPEWTAPPAGRRGIPLPACARWRRRGRPLQAPAWRLSRYLARPRCAGGHHRAPRRPRAREAAPPGGRQRHVWGVVRGMVNESSA